MAVWKKKKKSLSQPSPRGRYKHHTADTAKTPNTSHIGSLKLGPSAAQIATQYTHFIGGGGRRAHTVNKRTFGHWRTRTPTHKRTEIHIERAKTHKHAGKPVFGQALETGVVYVHKQSGQVTYRCEQSDGVSLGINIRQEDPDFAHLAVSSAADHRQYCRW